MLHEIDTSTEFDVSNSYAYKAVVEELAPLKKDKPGLEALERDYGVFLNNGTVWWAKSKKGVFAMLQNILTKPPYIVMPKNATAKWLIDEAIGMFKLVDVVELVKPCHAAYNHLRTRYIDGAENTDPETVFAKTGLKLVEFRNKSVYIVDMETFAPYWGAIEYRDDF